MMIMKDCTGIICKMKTYKELKEQVLEENTATNEPSFVDRTKTAIMGKPISDYSKYGMYSASSYGKNQGGFFGKGGLASQGIDYFKKNKGTIGAVGAGVVGLGLLTGLIRGRQGRRDNAPQSGTVPAPNLQQTTVSAPGTVGTPTERISRAVTQISPVKPIDNRTSRNA